MISNNYFSIDYDKQLDISIYLQNFTVKKLFN